MKLYTKAVLKRLAWTAVLTLVALCIYMVAIYAGLPQMPTVGWILVGIVACSFVLAGLFQSTDSDDSPDRQQRD